MLAEAKATLEGLPKDALPGSPNALAKQTWGRRVQLLDEALALITRLEAPEVTSAEGDARRQTLVETLTQHAALPPVAAVVAPTPTGFEELDAKVAAQRERVSSLRTEEAERIRYVEQLPAQLAQSRARLQAALERSSGLTRDAEVASVPAQQANLRIRAANATLDADVARLQARVLERDREQEKVLAPLRVNTRDLAEQRLERLEQEYAAYRDALEREIDRDALRLAQEVARLEKVLETTTDPATRFLTAKQLEMAVSAKKQSDAGKFLLALGADLEDQQSRLLVEVSELTSLRSYLEKAGSGVHAGERIQFTMRRVKLRRHALEHALRRDFAAELSAFRSRRFELEDKLFLLKETWQREVTSTIETLTEPQRRSFRTAAQRLLEPYSTALRQESGRLTEVIGKGQDLQVALIERQDALDALETFIRSKVFWIRGAKPFGPAIWPQVAAEAEVVSAWAGGLGSPQPSTRITEGMSLANTILMLVLLVVALPIGLFWVRQRLRRFVTRMNDRTLQDDARIIDRLLAIGAGAVSVALLPALVFAVGRSLDVVGLPGALVPVLRSLFDHLAIALLFWLLSRSFFAGRGTAQVQFGMDRDAAHALHRSLCVLLLGYLVFDATRAILSRPPFQLDLLPLDILPRLAYTLFLIVAVIAGILLLRPRSAFTQRLSVSLGNNLLGRRWPMLAGLLCLMGVGVVVLEVTGYRYSAGVLTKSLALSLATMLLLVPLYKGAVAMLTLRARRSQSKQLRADNGNADADTTAASDAEPAAPAEDPDEVTAAESHSQVHKLVQILFVIGGLVLIAGFWGIDSQAFQTLDQLQAYDLLDIGEENLFVSYGDLLRAVFCVFGAYLVLKYLPGLYEYGVFSRLDIDSGLKYAILTMSRYGVFTLAAIITLSMIKLDLGRLGWLMAAMGVGLGFGLQEIVSNFVSGIILLIERPVRVGDVVTIGAISGKVQRINIRATSVINFDRQEIIVPNRSLITKEVTNWTRGDTIIRLVVPIGVAYGSDVDQVTNILLEVALEQPEILADPEPKAFFLAHGESSLNFELRVFVPDPSMKTPLLHRINSLINRRLTEQGIEIPFPQRDLHIKSSSVPWPAAGSDDSSGEPAVKK